MQYEMIIMFTAVVLTCLLMNSKVFKAQKKWFKITLICVLLVAVIIRTVKLGSAMGLNSDEAMGGSNAWSLAHYGVSMHLNSLPVYLIAWGSGMNILYPLLIVPLLKITGLSVVAYRFPLVLLSVISYYALSYVLLKTKHNSKFSLFFITILTLSPWTILANRWAVESNLFPIIMIFALCCYLMWSYYDFKGLKSNIFFVIFNILIAISAYAYSCDWIFLAFFTVILYGWLLYKKKIKVRHVVVAFGICLLIVWPLILFIYVNYLGGHQMKIGEMTITKMTGNRSSDAWVIVKDNPIKQIFINIFRFLYYIVFLNCYYSGDQGLHFNACYPFMMLIAVFGLLYTLFKKNREKSDLEKYLLITTIASIPLILVTWNNMVRDNVLILPVFYYATVGVLVIFKTKRMQQIFAGLFAICVLGFSYEYFYAQTPTLADNPVQGVTGNQTSIYLPKALDKALENSNSKTTIYLNQKYIGSLYTAVLFYHPMNPYEFVEDTNHFKKDIFNDKSKHKNDYHFGKYYITTNIKDKMINNPNGVYVVRNDVSHAKYHGMKSYSYGPYTVYVHERKER